MNTTENNKSRVIVENGEVKTILSEEIQKTGWMTPEEMEDLLLQYFAKIKELRRQQNASQN